MRSKAIVLLFIVIALTHAHRLNGNGGEDGKKTASKETGPISRETQITEPHPNDETDTNPDENIEPGGNIEPEPDGTIEPDQDGSVEPDLDGDTDLDPDAYIDLDPEGDTDPDPEENTDTGPDPEENTDTGPDPEENTDTDPDPEENTNTGPDPEENTDTDPAGSEQEETLKTVETDLGPVTAVNLHGCLGIRSYLDIPYGKFDKLFEAPRNPPIWLEHNVIAHSKRCPQLQNSDIVLGDTDCLTLSVFTPSDVMNAPVLFHVYDGDFTTGSADSTIYGPEHLVPKGVILVMPNYRLGPLGFLCAPGSGVIPGNAALKDLTLALDWTKRNIEAFGGNPSNIIVSGEGNAGALVGYLTISPASRHYIAKAIVESGSVLSHWAVDRNPEETATYLASQVVTGNEGLKNLEIFERTDVNTLLRAANHTKYKPCVDTGMEAFLNATPWSILQEMKTNISYMIGTADNAGMHEALEHTESSIYHLNKNFSLCLPSDLKFKSGDDILDTSDRLKKLYFGELDITVRDREKLAVWHTDTSYLGPLIRAARQLVKAGATVYFYEFSFVGGLNRERNALTQPLHGAARGDIIGYVFCQDGDMPQPGSVEEQMVDTMTDLWVDFMKTGKPSALWNTFETYATSEEEWLSIGQQVAQMQGVHVQRLDIWVDLYEKYFVDRSHAIKVQGTLVTVATLMVMTSLSGLF